MSLPRGPSWPVSCRKDPHFAVRSECLCLCHGPSAAVPQGTPRIEWPPSPPCPEPQHRPGPRRLSADVCEKGMDALVPDRF